MSLNGGGAIFNNGGTLTLASVVFSNNAANNPIGGAIATTGGSLGMTNVTFAGNAAGVAGALRIRSGTVAGIGVTFSANNGEFGGGSIYIDGGSLNLTNSTIDGSAGLNGFGIGVHNAGGAVSLTNVTIAHSQGYALLTDAGASTTIKNTLIGVGGRGDCRQAGQNDSVTDTRTAAAVTVDGGNNLDQNGDCGLSGVERQPDRRSAADVAGEFRRPDRDGRDPHRQPGHPCRLRLRAGRPARHHPSGDLRHRSLRLHPRARRRRSPTRPPIRSTAAATTAGS